MLILILWLTAGCAAHDAQPADSQSADSQSRQSAPTAAVQQREDPTPPPDASTDVEAGVKADVETKVQPDVVSYPVYRDPLMPVNRAIFAFNDVTFRYVLIPMSEAYVNTVPEPVRGSVGNFFYNLKTPIYAVNNLLQLKFEPLGRNLLRFGINTTVGLLGLFDPASHWFDIARAETHFEQTLSGYGAGYGTYLVLPILGPSDLRNGASAVVDYLLNPIPYLVGSPGSTVLRGFDHFQGSAPDADRYEALRAEADDPYVFFRNLYLQGVQRDAEE